MATLHEFGIIPVARGLNGKLLVQKEITFSSEEEAQRAGQVFANVLGGAVAFRRMSDREAGIVGQGVIIGRYGLMAGTERGIASEPGGAASRQL
jgi:hypothetical protein